MPKLNILLKKIYEKSKRFFEIRIFVTMPLLMGFIGSYLPPKQE